MRYDARPRAIGLGERLVDEVDVTLLRLRVGRAVEQNSLFSADEGHSCRQHLIEDLDESLMPNFGQRFNERLADDVAPADHVVIRLVHELEDVIRSAQHREERRRETKYFGESCSLDSERVEQLLALRDVPSLGDDECRLPQFVANWMERDVEGPLLIVE